MEEAFKKGRGSYFADAALICPSLYSSPSPLSMHRSPPILPQPNLSPNHPINHLPCVLLNPVPIRAFPFLLPDQPLTPPSTPSSSNTSSSLASSSLSSSPTPTLRLRSFGRSPSTSRPSPFSPSSSCSPGRERLRRSQPTTLLRWGCTGRCTSRIGSTGQCRTNDV
jgi:hypothetical protein